MCPFDFLLDASHTIQLNESANLILPYRICKPKGFFLISRRIFVYNKKRNKEMMVVRQSLTVNIDKIEIYSAHPNQLNASSD